MSIDSSATSPEHLGGTSDGPPADVADRDGPASEPELLARSVVGALGRIGPVAVAVSGGVDSMTLAHLAAATLGEDATLFHAVSAAVPAAATERVRRHAAAAGWRLREIDAGELGDERYLANPVDRCFFCKTDLYGSIGRLTEHTIVSGTNLDDLDDYRPGLRAADDHRVRHPFVEAGVDKAGVRAIATWLGLTDLAELPAAPCLASRIETGIRVTPERLVAVDRVETMLREALAPVDVRCRIRADTVGIEIDEPLVVAVDVAAVVAELARHGLDHLPVRVERYRRGSAFLHVVADTGTGRS